MNSGLGNQPNCIIIGAMKCATSTLHDQLNMHDSFFMTDPKEPYFFSDDAVYAKGVQWYESLFAEAKAGQLKGESSTHYTKLPTYPDTVKRMAAYCPSVKCIYIMRHPVDRLVSHYIHEWTQGVISCNIDNAVYRHPELIAYSRYNMQIEPYLDFFGHAAVLPLFSERLRNNPQHELQEVFGFLGVDETPVWHENIRSNISAERLQKCAWRDVLVNNYALQFLRKKFVPKKIRTVIKNFWAMRERPELSPEVLKYLKGVFDKDLQKIGLKLDLELNCENYKQQILSQKKIKWTK
jgi:hypothetical protein